MPNNRVEPEKLRRFFEAQSRGAKFMEACLTAGISPAIAKKYQDALDGKPAELWRTHAVKQAIEAFPARDKWGMRDEETFEPVTILDPKPRSALSIPALNALNNVELFAERYFGVMLAPWQRMAAERIVKLLASEEKEYACINVAPGSGKTVFFTLIVPAWLICRDRTIRGMTGHASANISKQEVDNLRRVLERDIPVRATDTDIKLSIGKDAVATLAEDYGRFKPLPSENAPWRAEYFSVAQLGGIPLSEKERTWSAIGFSSIYIGTRVNFAVWDDADDPKAASELTRDQIKRSWDQVAEQRIEPGGLLVIQGQRLGGDDLYRHCIDKKRLPDDIDDLDDDKISEYPPLYHHILFKAHYEELCKGAATHKRSSPPWPEGCLLFPSRVSWRQLQQIKLNNPRDFEVLYQQQDIDQKHVLVRDMWIQGGKDPDTGEEYIGCWDKDRGLCEWPRGLSQPFYSIATADPSPANYWAIQWYLYHPASQQRFLLDLIASPLTAPEVLDWDVTNQKFTGIMEEWQTRSRLLGAPIQYWIVEANAAQRFILQYSHVKNWVRKWGVTIIPHQTTSNKSDPNYGVWSLAPHYRFGRIRLPAAGQAKMAVQRLVNEVTRYPDARYDDQVMAQWFMEWNLPRLSVAGVEEAVMDRPSWSNRIGGRFLVRR